MPEVKPIHTDADLDAALGRIGELLKSEPGSPEYDELSAVSDMVEAYEDNHHPIGLPSIIGVIEYHMDQHGLTVDDLIPLIGSSQKVAEVLSGRRDITMPMARALHQHWGISAEVLLQKPLASGDTSRDNHED